MSLVSLKKYKTTIKTTDAAMATFLYAVAVCQAKVLVAIMNGKRWTNTGYGTMEIIIELEESNIMLFESASNQQIFEIEEKLS